MEPCEEMTIPKVDVAPEANFKDQRDLLCALRTQQSLHEDRVEALLKAMTARLEELISNGTEMRLEQPNRNSAMSRTATDFSHGGRQTPKGNLRGSAMIRSATSPMMIRTKTDEVQLPGTPDQSCFEREESEDKCFPPTADDADDPDEKPVRQRSRGGGPVSIREQITGLEHQKKTLWRARSLIGVKTSLYMRLKARAVKVSNGRQFETCVALLILASAIVTGLQEDWQVGHVGETRTPLGFILIGVFINVCFLLEILLRVFAEGKKFCNRENRNFSWNIFDSMLVMFSLVDELFTHLASSAPNVKAVRLLRLMRIVRVVRVIRVLKFFSELRVMVQGIMSSAKPLFWALILLLTIMYMFGVCILPFISEELLLRLETPDADVTNRVGLPIEDTFGSLGASIVTLFLSISGGVSWRDVALPLAEISPFLGVAFAMYVAFASFCVLNIITGVFVESASRFSNRDDDMMMAEEIETRLHWYQDVKELFAQADVNDDGSVEKREFCKLVEDIRIQRSFKKLGMEVDPTNAHAVFNLLDIDDSGSVDLEKFALGVQQFHGHAKSLDIARVRLDSRKLNKRMTRLIEAVDALASHLGGEYEYFGDENGGVTTNSVMEETFGQAHRQISPVAKTPPRQISPVEKTPLAPRSPRPGSKAVPLPRQIS